ncbi:class I SAM-dependent methyltransferase [Sphingobacterium composti Ten et al. 2007 non Yoo et al. 2007]|uniref:class I SAM-dependent methyltransferase n=1 Tax=Sphingobacterium composti TaxID=363260 RepID=UPI00135770C7|nr:class I SAM-dependent methyltransferase [Sphingobacterium composti Ten et al. 2007 non Yoo et al. 2007]
MLNIYDPAFVKKLFNRMSASYERMNYITSLGFSLIWRHQFIDTIKTSDQPVQVLDLLSGLGENWSILLKKFPNGKFVALDFSESMIQSSSKKNHKKLNNRFLILQQDILANELHEGKYDIITCAFGLKTFDEEQLQQLAKRVFNALKKDGKFSFIEISMPPNKILCFFYKLYLSKIIPVLGSLFLGNPSDYKLLWVYTEKFKNCNKAKLIFEENGLHVKYKSYFFGCATGLIGTKQPTTNTL